MYIGEVSNESCAVSDHVGKNLKINNLPELRSQAELEIATFKSPMPYAFSRAVLSLLPVNLSRVRFVTSG